MNYPLVSIVIPNFNRQYLINETLSSLIKQSYPHWEAIVVDDKSTDNSKEVIDKWAAVDPRIQSHIRKGELKGAPVCRNQGMDLAKGRYVIFLDSDDILAPWCLKKRIAYMENHPELNFAVFPVILFNKYPGDCNILWNVQSPKEDLLRFVGGDGPWQTSSPIWRKEALLKVGLWNTETKNWQDWEFHIRALLNKLNYKKVETTPDCFYRLAGDSKISGFTNSANNIAYIVSLHKLFSTVDEIILTKVTDAKPYRKLLAGHYFKLSQKIAFYSLPIELSKFFKVVSQRNMVAYPIYTLSLIYLIFYQLVRKYKVPLLSGLLYYIAKNTLRNYYFDSSFREKKTQQKVKLSQKSMKQLQYLLSVNGFYNATSTSDV